MKKRPPTTAKTVAAAKMSKPEIMATMVTTAAIMKTLKILMTLGVTMEEAIS
jgi:hypothetical protein